MIVITQDRYGGVFIDGARGGASWFAMDNVEVPISPNERTLYRLPVSRKVRLDLLNQSEGPWGDDPEARNFCDQPPKWIAWGATPDAALKALEQKLES